MIWHTQVVCKSRNQSAFEHFPAVRKMFCWAKENQMNTMLDTEFAVAVSGFFYARKVDDDEEKRKAATVCSRTESV